MLYGLGQRLRWTPKRNRRVPAVAAAPLAARLRAAWPQLTYALVLGGVCAGLGAAALAGGRMLLHVGPLRVHGIEINGLARTSREALLTQAGLQLHQPLLLLDLQQAVHAIEGMDWVQRATVRRQLPDKLRIEVQEHVGKAAAMVGELWLINPDGEPFKRFSAHDGLVLPVITGVRGQPAADVPLAAQPALVGRLKDGLDLLDALAAVRDDLYSVDELHYDADLGWSSVLLLGRAYARTGQPRPTATVHLGPDPQARLGVLTDVLGQLADRREVPEVIWAAHVHQEGRVQVQLAPAAAAARAQAAGNQAARPGRGGRAARRK